MRITSTKISILILTITSLMFFGCYSTSSGKDSVPEQGELNLRIKEDSPLYEEARLSMMSPGEIIGNTVVPFEFMVENYELGAQTPSPGNLGNSEKGQHIHLIINNNPYQAHYSTRFEVELPEGNHAVLAFLSRSYHESLKHEGAYVLGNLQVGSGEEEGIDLEAPHLFYSRPKGTYKNFSGELLLDFYLVNTTLSEEGNKVRATINNGEEFLLTQWRPYVIEGLSPGEVTIKLELIDSEGDVIPGPFNSVERSVTLISSME